MINPFTDEYFMKKALQEAEMAFEKDEIPVGAVIVIATRSIIDVNTALIAIVTVFALLYIKKIKEPYIIAIAALIGIVIKLIL